MWILRKGDTLEIGRAEISLNDGRLILKDEHVKRSILTDAEEVEVRPHPPVNVPSRVTDYLMIRMREGIVPADGQELWLSAPYDLGISLDGEIVGFLSPFRVKYSLYGPTTEGVVCRYHESPVSRAPQQGIDAKVKVIFKVESPREVDRIVIPVNELDIFLRNEDGAIYYEVVEVTVGDDLYVELKNEPPVEADLVYPPVKSVDLIQRIASGYRMVW